MGWRELVATVEGGRLCVLLAMGQTCLSASRPNSSLPFILRPTVLIALAQQLQLSQIKHLTEHMSESTNNNTNITSQHHVLRAYIRFCCLKRCEMKEERFQVSFRQWIKKTPSLCCPTINRLITAPCPTEPEVSRRLQLAHSTFHRLSRVCKGPQIHIPIKSHLFTSPFFFFCVFS